jgi:hypothetical protein
MSYLNPALLGIVVLACGYTHFYWGCGAAFASHPIYSVMKFFVFCAFFGNKILDVLRQVCRLSIENACGLARDGLQSQSTIGVAKGGKPHDQGRTC